MATDVQNLGRILGADGCVAKFNKFLFMFSIFEWSPIYIAVKKQQNFLVYTAVLHNSNITLLLQWHHLNLIAIKLIFHLFMFLPVIMVRWQDHAMMLLVSFSVQKMLKRQSTQRCQWQMQNFIHQYFEPGDPKTGPGRAVKMIKLWRCACH